MNVLIWHRHGSWTTAFVQGAHTYLVPVLPDRPALGRGRAETWSWPASVVEVTPDQLAETAVDVVVIQAGEEEELARRWLGGRIPGRDVPLIWLEHDPPPSPCHDVRHRVADRTDGVLVHVTPTNALLWDAGKAPTTVIEHGIIDPGHRFTGTDASAAAVINEPVRRGRAVGADLLAPLAQAGPLHLYGMGQDEVAPTAGLHLGGDLDQASLHQVLGCHRAYVHPYRWTSLGLALLEAMAVGLPVVALATTEVPEVVPAEAGVVSNRLDRLAAGLQHYLADPEAARAAGCAARAAVLERFGVERFLADWDRLLTEVTA